ncbi:retention module-containing protein, partial [Pantoea sp. 18069]|uniref:retention module-containing protein n=1 Tax=Pantoea sp. 18069 TaxID=2681415 RepID=UPI00135726B2
MAAQTVLVTQLTGQAWIRGSDGSLTALHEGMRIPADAVIVTSSGGSVQLQADGQPPLIVGENQEVLLTADLVSPPPPQEAAIAAPPATEIEQIIAAINAGQDPFDTLDPTAATLSGGSEGGSTFVRLASILENTVPLALAYGNIAPVAAELPLFSGVAEAQDDAQPPRATPQANADAGAVLEDAAQPLRGNVLANDTLGEGALAEHQVVLTGSGQGQYGQITLGADGSYSYQLDSSLPSVQSLAAGETHTESFTYTLVDKDGVGSSSTLTVTIIGTNDAPTLSGQVAVVVTEDQVTAATGQLVVTDVDASDTHTWTVDNGGQGQYGSFTVDQTGKWTYVPGTGNADVQGLKAGEQLLDTITVTVDDGHGGTVSQTITVTIQGADDGAIITPATPGSDRGEVTEDTQLTTGGKLDIVDPDAGQAVFQPQAGTDGSYGTFTVDANGSWGYSLNNGDPAVQGLGLGETLTEAFTVTSADGATHTVNIVVNGTNDVPSMDGTVVGVVTEDGATTASGQLTATDVDTNDQLTWTVTGPATGQYGSIAVDQNGKWTYTLDNAKAQELTAADKPVESFTITVSDGHGGTVSKTIEVTVNGADDGAVITPHTPGADKGEVTEDTQLTTGGKLGIVDPDAGQAVFQPQAGTNGSYGTFTVDANGSWGYSLNNGDPAVQGLGVGETLTEAFTVTSADGATHTVNIVVNGTNDVPTMDGTVVGVVTEDGATTASGQLTATDVDTNDTLTWTVTGATTGQYGSIAVDQNGKWTYTLDNAKAQELTATDKPVESFTITVSDGHGGTVSKTIEVTVNGADDGAIITPHIPGDDKGAVTEDGQLTASGKLDVTDPDAGQAVFVPVVAQAGTYGNFSVDANGNWTFNLNNSDTKVQALGAGETLTETFVVTTADGTTGSVVITINGTNDKPVLSGALTGTVTEDGTQSAMGQLSTTDVDVNDTHSYSVVGASTGTYGSFSVDASGQWTYQLDNAAAQSLKTGDTRTETYQVQVSDGKGGVDTKDVTITINGTDDGAVIAPSKPGDDLGTVTEDGQLTAGGKLDVTDPDAGQAVFVVQSNVSTTYGQFTIGTDGTWTYTLDNANLAVQALGAGQTLTETREVVTADGTKASVVITINGTNDVPTLSTGVAAVTEDVGVVGGKLVTSGSVTIADVDTGESSFQAGATFTSSTGGAQLGALVFNTDGSYSYAVDNSLVQYLKTGESVIETYTVISKDGSATTTITITINGTDDGAVIAPSKPGDDAGQVQEDVTLTASGKLDVTDPDEDQAEFTPVTAHPGQYGDFSIDKNGNWTFNLNNGNATVQALGVGEHLTDTFTVTTIDGTTAQVTITIDGSNDKPVLSGALTGTVTEDGTQTAIGQLSTTDVDINDTHSYSVVGASTGTYGSFSVDASGQWTYQLDNAAAQSLKTGDVRTETYQVQVDDGKGGTDTKTVTITINGDDDGATITPNVPGADKGTVQEDVTLSANGKLDVTDPDAGQAEFTPVTAHPGQYGSFSVDKNGNWTFDLKNGNATVQALGVGEHLTDTFTVTTIDGTTAQVTITIDGSNDKPVLSGALTGTVTEDGTQTAIGQLSTTDVDINDTHSYSVVGASTGTYGSFSVDASGQWTYQLDNAAAQSLKTGDVRTETYTVQVSDGKGGTDTKTVTITINGDDDGAVIAPSKPGDDAGLVQEDVTLSVSGKLDVTDPDEDQAEFTPVTAHPGQYGDFSIDKNGNWTFDLKNGNATVQALGVGEHLTDTFTVTTIDGTTAQVTITINGTNDKPVLSGALTGTVTEDGTQSAIGQLATTDVDTN